MTTRYCQAKDCTGTLGRRQDRFCSRVCSAAEARGQAAPSRLALPDRECPACGALLVRREKEKASDFRLRKTCGDLCALRLRTAGKTAVLLPRPVVVIAPPNRPLWRPEGWPDEVPADVLRHRGVTV
ncbi:hypothetical protein [Pseudonocardia sp. NPDC049154]|uniref:hypothetical protein n=1 Tax=Pseudonocardia sp. NPDC049154 TaxID=3155501 RepID=UPI0033CABEF1